MARPPTFSLSKPSSGCTKRGILMPNASRLSTFPTLATVPVSSIPHTFQPSRISLPDIKFAISSSSSNADVFSTTYDTYEKRRKNERKKEKSFHCFVLQVLKNFDFSLPELAS